MSNFFYKYLVKQYLHACLTRSVVHDLDLSQNFLTLKNTSHCIKNRLKKKISILFPERFKTSFYFILLDS